MTTPTFKLLVNALRLGQPPEPMAAFKVLVEVIQLQESELADLRQRVNLLASRLQFAEAKASRMEAASLGMSGQNHPAVQQDPLPTIPAMPPAPREPRRGPTGPHPILPQPVQPQRDHASGRPPPMDLRAKEEQQDPMNGTLNVPRADIDAVVANLVEREAPYPLAPPGGHRAPQETTGMPFKARPLDPSGGSLHGPMGSRDSGAHGSNAHEQGRTAPSRPPPAMPPHDPGKSAYPPPYAASNRPRSVPPPPPPMRSPSVPYIAIEEVQPDTFSVTGELDDDDIPIDPPGSVPISRAKAEADEIARRGPPKLQSILDESSYDDSVMTHVRKPGGQGD
jgi:hypothetical protein